MKTLFVEQQFKYDGSQLQPRYAYLKHNVLGDSIIAWIGACDIPFANMVDGEDLLAKSEIRGDLMLHFIVEKFDVQLFSGVTLQRLLASIVKDLLLQHSPQKDLVNKLTRDGDDIYCGQKKFSISIATQSVNSTLIHFAVNIVNTGTPVPTLSLEDLHVEPVHFAQMVLEKFAIEVRSIVEATQKVRTFN